MQFILLRSRDVIQMVLRRAAREGRDGSPGQAVTQLSRPIHRTTTRVAFLLTMTHNTQGTAHPTNVRAILGNVAGNTTHNK